MHVLKQGLTLQLPQRPHQVEIKYSPGTSPVLCLSLLLVTVELRTFPQRFCRLPGCHFWVPSLCFSPTTLGIFSGLVQPCSSSFPWPSSYSFSALGWGQQGVCFLSTLLLSDLAKLHFLLHLGLLFFSYCKCILDFFNLKIIIIIIICHYNMTSSCSNVFH